eukprot:Em0006g1522a
MSPRRALKAATVRDALMKHYLAGRNTQLCCSRCHEHFVIMWQGTRSPRLSRRTPRDQVERRCYSQGTRYLRHLERHHGITSPTVAHAPVAMADLDQSRKRHQGRRDARLGARLAALEEVLEAEGEDMSSDEGELAPPLPAILPTMKAIEELWVYIKALEERVLNLEVIVHAAVQAAPPQPSALLGA